MQRAVRSVLIAGVALPLLATPAVAESLREALTKAYLTNPTLAGARAGQRGLDENIPITRSQGLPTANVSGQYTENIQVAQAATPARQASARLDLSVPLYLGGAVRFGTRAADSRIAAGRASLRGTEATLFSQVVNAYMNVLRDEAIVTLNAKQVAVLKTNLEATRDRFEVGDLTRTDIAQSESRLAVADGQLETARAQLINSRENYVQLVGNAPGALDQPPVLPNLPATPDLAVVSALENNPDIAAAKKNLEATGFDIKAAQAARLPQVSAVANKSYANFLGSLQAFIPGFAQAQAINTSSAGLQLTMPLFQGGRVSAQVRQAQARSGQALEQAIAVERDVIAQTRSAYASWRASNEVIRSSEVAVAAARLSLEGVRAENSVGNRTILDILNAEQELLNAEVQLVSARRNAYVAGFTLLAAMGQAEAEDLGLDGGSLYDPTINYNRVRNILWDWKDDPKPVASGTRTIDTAAQTSSVSANPGQ